MGSSRYSSRWSTSRGESGSGSDGNDKYSYEDGKERSRQQDDGGHIDDKKDPNDDDPMWKPHPDDKGKKDKSDKDRKGKSDKQASGSGDKMPDDGKDKTAQVKSAQGGQKSSTGDQGGSGKKLSDY